MAVKTCVLQDMTDNTTIKSSEYFTLGVTGETVDMRFFWWFMTLVLPSVRDESLKRSQKSSLAFLLQVFQAGCIQPLFMIAVFCELLQHVHDLSLVDLRGGLGLCCPVIDVPVVAWFVDQSVVLLQLVLTHCVQVSLGKEAEQYAVLQHAPLPAFIEQAPSLDVSRLSGLILPGG